MRTARRLSTVIVLVCLICNAASFGEGTDKVRTELKFEISSGKYDIRSDLRSVLRHVTDKSKNIKPTHVAIMAFGDNIFFMSTIKPDAILDTASGKKMSDSQKKLVKTRYAIDPTVTKEAIWSNFYEVDESGNFKDLRIKEIGRIRLFAVSEDDAKKMAAAFIESWQNKMGAEVQRILEKKKEFEKKVPELRKRRTEAREELDELEKTLKEKLSKGLHSLDDNYAHNTKAMDEARQAARELYIELNLVNIEIKIIKARLSAATVYQARENANPTVQAKLEEILCEQTVELAGTLERQAGITNTLRQEEEIYRLYVQFYEVRNHISACDTDASDAEHNIKLAIEQFEYFDSSYPRVADNKVSIHPVEF